MAGTAGVAGGPELTSDASDGASKGGEKLENPLRRGILRQLLDVNAGEAPPLVVLCIAVALKVGHMQDRAVQEPEGLLLVVPVGVTEVHVGVGVDWVAEGLPGLAHHQAARMGGVLVGMEPELTERGVGFSAATGTAVDNDVEGGADERHLRTRLGAKTDLDFARSLHIPSHG